MVHMAFLELQGRNLLPNQIYCMAEDIGDHVINLMIFENASFSLNVTLFIQFNSPFNLEVGCLLRYFNPVRPIQQWTSTKAFEETVSVIQ